MRPILAMALKDIRLLIRDRMAFFFTFIFPVVFGIFFGMIFSGGGGGGGDDGRNRVRLQLVDEDRSPESAAFAADLAASENLAITPAESRSAAEAAVRLGGGPVGFIVLPEGYGRRASMPFAGQPAAIEIAGDPSRNAEIGLARGIVTELAFRSLSRTMADTAKMRDGVRESMRQLDASQDVNPVTRATMRTFFGTLDAMLAAVPQSPPGADASAAQNPLASWQPVKVETSVVRADRRGPTNAFDVSFAQAILWGVLGCASGFAIGLTEERKAGTLLRLRVAPISWVQLLAGKALGCFLACLGVVAFMMTLGILVFNVSVGSWPMLIIAVTALCAGFVGIMMLLSVLGRKTGSGQFGWAVMLVFSLIGGGTVPLFVMPGWMQSLSSISPVKWGILALEGAIWRGYDLPQMMLPVLVLAGIAVVGFAAGAWLFARGESSQ